MPYTKHVLNITSTPQSPEPEAVPPGDARPRHGEGREALLSATVHVVAAKGLRGMTFRAVADEAGVNNSLIAHHFGTRDALLAAALEWSAERSIGLSDLAEYANDAQAYRVKLIDTLLSEPELQLFQFEMILEASRRPHLRPAVHRLYDRYVDELARGRSLRRDPSQRALDRAMFAALDGLVFQYLSQAISAEEFADSVDAMGTLVAASAV